MGETVIFFLCWTCGKSSVACPNCVIGLPIDPETNLPPDLVREGNDFRKIEPDPSAVRRAIKHPICDGCANKAGFQGTAEDRHANKNGLCDLI